MSSKIDNLSELSTILCDNNKTDKGVLHFSKTFKISRRLTSFDVFKIKGICVSVLLTSLIIFRLRGANIYQMVISPLSLLPKIDDNTFYRLMNNSRMDWRKLLISFAKQFNSIVKEKGDRNNGIKCFVLDDTDLIKTGTTIELISRIFSHVTKTYPLGFKMLLLAYWDGKSLIPVDFSFHREKGKKGNYGLSTKELKSQFHKSRDPKTPAYKRMKEVDEKKTDIAIEMIKRSLKNGFSTSYVLMDSWFTNDYVIKSIRSLKDKCIHVLGMCKIDNRKYTFGGNLLNASQLIINNERKFSKYSKVYKSHYISLITDYKGESVRLFFVKYNKSKTYTLLLTTDLTLSFVKAIELYQIRWTIEVLFKECKQYLRLGRCQNTDFDGQIADATLTLTTHIILSLQKRFESYETMGDIFRETQQKLLELTLLERLLKLLIKLIKELLEIISVDIDEILETLLQNNKASIQLMAMLQSLSISVDNPQKTTQTSIRLANC